AGGDLGRLRANLEGWFNGTMDRVAGWYKRWTQAVIFALGLALVAFLDVDTIALASSLAGDPAQRQYLIAAAQEAAKHRPGDSGDDPKKRIQAHLQEMRQLGLAVGWDQADARTWPQGGWGWVKKVVGLLVTAVAIMLGAPFWFDLLNKFMVVRSTVKPEEKSPKEKTKD